MEDQLIETAVNYIQPVLEAAIVLAAEYSKKAGRDYVTAEDFNYAMKYACRNYVGKHSGTLFPELADEEDPGDIEVIEETESSFTRYQGDDELMNSVNECYDTWDDWLPSNPLERMLCESIKKNLVNTNK